MDDVSVNFIELVALTRITAESTVEKFGPLINSSFFDASNILAGLKMKGFVDFITAFPSQSTLKLTDKGAALLAEANKKAQEPIDALDNAMLTQLAGGRRSLADIGGALNVTQKDLAMHIYKLASQQDLAYELVNATVSMYLTEKGFVAAKGMGQQAAASAAPALGTLTEAGGVIPQQANGAQKMDGEIKILEQISKKRRQRKVLMILGIAVVVALIAMVFILGVIKI